MKNTLMLLLCVAMSGVVFGQTASVAKAPADVAVASWETESHDFGKIKQGVPVTHEFKFVNNGNTPLIISNVSASCGCTTPLWSREPVMPGQSGFVKATFSAAALGAFDKTVTVTANVEQGSVQLKIKGEVAQQAIQ